MGWAWYIMVCFSVVQAGRSPWKWTEISLGYRISFVKTRARMK